MREESTGAGSGGTVSQSEAENIARTAARAATDEIKLELDDLREQLRRSKGLDQDVIEELREVARTSSGKKAFEATERAARRVAKQEAQEASRKVAQDVVREAMGKYKGPAESGGSRLADDTLEAVRVAARTAAAQKATEIARLAAEQAAHEIGARVAGEKAREATNQVLRESVPALEASVAKVMQMNMLLAALAAASGLLAVYLVLRGDSF